VPQPQEAPSPPPADPVDVPGQTTDPVNLGTSSVVPPDQTIAIPPQGKVSVTGSLPMISFNIIVTFGNFQLKIFHRQLQPIKLWCQLCLHARDKKSP
jgi:hypothetical protein